MEDIMIFDAQPNGSLKMKLYGDSHSFTNTKEQVDKIYSFWDKKVDIGFHAEDKVEEIDFVFLIPEDRQSLIFINHIDKWQATIDDQESIENFYNEVCKAKSYTES